MSSNSVKIIAKGDFRAAEPNQVLIVAGDTVTFSAPVGGATVIAFTPATAALLTPMPAGSVEVAGDASTTFTFGTPGDGRYCCQLFATLAEVHAVHCPVPEEGAILSILSSDRDLPPPPITTS